MKSKRIVIDARMYGLEHAGIGRYVMNLVHHLDQIVSKSKTSPSRDQYYLLLRKKYYRGLKLKSQNFKKILTDYPHYSLQEQLFLPLQLIKLRPALTHFPHFNVPVLWPGRYIVTIHDLIKHESKGPATTTLWQPFYWLKHLVYRFVVWMGIKRSIKIIVSSKWWQEELAKRYRFTPGKIIVIYDGVEEKFKTTKTTTGKYKVNLPFVIYAGNLYPHKNIERLVEAVKNLNNKDHLNLNLVVVCARSIFYDRFKEKVRLMGAEKFVNLAGFVPDEELAALYQQAEALVFPSLLEGFGLPGLEAMAVGLPVVAANASCLPEVYGKAALYFDPLDVDDMAAKIKKVMEDESLRERLKTEGFKQVKKYSWRKTAEQTLEVYERCTSS